MTALVLTFRECGLMGRQTAYLGEFLIGSVEAPGVSSRKAIWSFYPDTGRPTRLQSAPSLEAARNRLQREAEAMLEAFGLTVAVVAVIEPTRAVARAQRSARA